MKICTAVEVSHSYTPTQGEMDHQRSCCTYKTITPRLKILHTSQENDGRGRMYIDSQKRKLQSFFLPFLASGNGYGYRWRWFYLYVHTILLVLDSAPTIELNSALSRHVPDRRERKKEGKSRFLSVSPSALKRSVQNINVHAQLVCACSIRIYSRNTDMPWQSLY